MQPRNKGSITKNTNAQKLCKQNVANPNFQILLSLRSSQELFHSSIPPQVAKPASIKPKHTSVHIAAPKESSSKETLFAPDLPHARIIAVKTYAHKLDPPQS